MSLPPHLQALERLLPTLHEPCLRWATRCCGGDHDEGSDLVQELYIRLWDGRLTPPTGLISSDQVEPLRAWLFAVLRRLASNQLRTLKRHIRLLNRGVAELSLTPSASQTPDAASELIERSERADSRVALRSALNQLSSRQREVIELVFHHELTIEQASEVMGVSLGSARVHYDRAKRRLSQLLSQEPPSSPLHSTSTSAGDLS